MNRAVVTPRRPILGRIVKCGKLAWKKKNGMNRDGICVCVCTQHPHIDRKNIALYIMSARTPADRFIFVFERGNGRGKQARVQSESPGGDGNFATNPVRTVHGYFVRLLFRTVVLKKPFLSLVLSNNCFNNVFVRFA